MRAKKKDPANIPLLAELRNQTLIANGHSPTLSTRTKCLNTALISFIFMHKVISERGITLPRAELVLFFQRIIPR